MWIAKHLCHITAATHLRTTQKGEDSRGKKKLDNARVEPGTSHNSHYDAAALTTAPQALDMGTNQIEYILSFVGLRKSAHCHLLEYSTI